MTRDCPRTDSRIEERRRRLALLVRIRLIAGMPSCIPAWPKASKPTFRAGESMASFLMAFGGMPLANDSLGGSELKAGRCAAISVGIDDIGVVWPDTGRAASAAIAALREGIESIKLAACACCFLSIMLRTWCTWISSLEALPPLAAVLRAAMLPWGPTAAGAPHWPASAAAMPARTRVLATSAVQPTDEQGRSGTAVHHLGRHRRRHGRRKLRRRSECLGNCICDLGQLRRQHGCFVGQRLKVLRARVGVNGRRKGEGDGVQHGRHLGRLHNLVLIDSLGKLAGG